MPDPAKAAFRGCFFLLLPKAFISRSAIRVFEWVK